MVVVMLIIIVMVVMFVVVIVVIIVIVVVMFVVIIIIFFGSTFHFVNPGSRSSHLIEVKLAGIHQFIEVNIAVVALYYLRLRLQCAHYLAYALQFGWLHHRSLIE